MCGIYIVPELKSFFFFFWHVSQPQNMILTFDSPPGVKRGKIASKETVPQEHHRHFESQYMITN